MDRFMADSTPPGKLVPVLSVNTYASNCKIAVWMIFSRLYFGQLGVYLYMNLKNKHPSCEGGEIPTQCGDGVVVLW
jgi:hypothetical protein